MKKKSPGPYPLPDGPPETLASFAKRLDWLRYNISEEEIVDADGKRFEFRDLPPHEADLRIWEEVRHYFLYQRGTTFRSPFPYYLDNENNSLLRLDGTPPAPEFMRLLRRLHLLASQKATKLVALNIQQIGEVSPQRELHHLSYMSDSAIYLNAGNNLMIKITSDSIEEVPLNTDGVILIADDIGVFPPLTELTPIIDEMRPKVDTACTKLLPDLPMTKLLTTRWAKDGILTEDQNHQMFLTRFLFIPAASKYSLWPLTLLTGEQGSAKSSALEMQLTMLRGQKSLCQGLPAKEDALIASITNRSVVAYDNIDSFGLDDPKKASYSDTLCHIATGAEIDMRRLFTTNVKDTYKIHNHGWFTSRTNPFSRSDVMRRTLHLDVAPQGDPKTEPKVVKETLFNKVLAARPALLAEYILRSQNILRAHLNYGDKTYDLQSEMPEYECFCMRVAEYEGTLQDTTELWAAYVRKYSESISLHNALVFTVRCWLGKAHTNANREVTSTTLFGELRNVSEELGQPFVYKSPNAFGARLAKEMSSLKVIGYSRVHTDIGTVYKFTASEAEMRNCRAIYTDLSATQKTRPFNLMASRSNDRPKTEAEIEAEFQRERKRRELCHVSDEDTESIQ